MDVTDPYGPVPVGIMPTEDDTLILHPGTPVTVAGSHDNRTYVMLGSEDGIRILNVTDLYAPMLLNNTLAGEASFSLDPYPWYITLFGADDGRTYALTGSGSGMQILDVTKPYVSETVESAKGDPAC